MFNEPIDVVYTWVDGQTDAFRQRFQSTRSLDGINTDGNAEHKGRFRDNGELRASLRSLDSFAPWIRRIFLVTAHETPRWLDTGNNIIHKVSHEELFRGRGRLPTFNSNAIELQLHHIPGLSRRFLYFNDDVLLGMPMQPSDILTPQGGQRVFLQDTPLPLDPDNGPVHDRAYAYTQGLLTWLPKDRPARRLPAHGPLLLDREILMQLEARVPEAFADTSRHQFRSPRDLVLRVLYLLHLIEDKTESWRHEVLVYNDQGPEYMLVRLDQGIHFVQNSFHRIESRPPLFYCINDDLADADGDHPTIQAAREFLRRVQPRACRFERSDSAVV